MLSRFEFSKLAYRLSYFVAFVTAGVSFAACTFQASAADAKRPNIVFIMADDKCECFPQKAVLPLKSQVNLSCAALADHFELR